MSVRPAHLVLLSVLTGGSLLGASAHGLVRLDDRLARAAEAQRIEQTIERMDRDCPFRERKQEL